ncbi:hypothetical protein PG999_000473 [Apiospora kogelbergensis]|uniref:FAD-binding domain-containing protein n=1 Tax=Apiospora kogelbergensis TaxID=1337665 RepID=A0AAW0RBM6_9PEZI
MAPLQVVIVGGGLSGACLANGLVNQADDGLVDVTIYERDTEADRRDGYQIRLGAHALVGFRACLTAPQYADCLGCFGRSGGVVSSAPAIFNPNMDLVLDLSKFPAYQKSAPVGRARLRDFLQAPLRARSVMRYGMKFTGFDVVDSSTDDDHKTSSRIRVYFEDGSSQECDILISAEGSGSRTNRQVGLNNIIEEKPKAGEGGFLGKCHLPWNVLRDLPRPLIEKGTIYAASSNAKIFSAAYLPDNLRPSAGAKAPGSGLSGAETKKPSDYDEDQASLFVAIAWENGMSAAEAAQLPSLEKKRLMGDMLRASGFSSDYLKLVEALDAEEIQSVPWRHSKADTPVDWRERLLSAAATRNSGPLDPRIGHPRVWLLGDSIHAMLPYRGMGANQAIHDTADALGPLLELARKKRADGTVTDAEVRRQLAVYENAMIPRAFAWVKQSAAQGLPDLDSFKGKVILVCVRAMLHVVGGVMSVLKMFGWTPKDDAPELP